MENLTCSASICCLLITGSIQKYYLCPTFPLNSRINCLFYGEEVGHCLESELEKSCTFAFLRSCVKKSNELGLPSIDEKDITSFFPS